MKKTGGLRRRWLINTLGLICALGLVCVMAVTVYFAARYYSELEWDLNSRGENTKEIFSDHDGQSYRIDRRPYNHRVFYARGPLDARCNTCALRTVFDTVFLCVKARS